MKDPLRIIFIVVTTLLVVTAGSLLYISYRQNQQLELLKINDFTSCQLASGTILESSPRQCKTTDGRLFVEVIKENAPDSGSQTEDQGTSQTDNTNQKEVMVKVFFPRNPDSSDNPEYTVAVNRTTKRTDIATFVLEQLIAGPSDSEKATGLYTAIKFSGTSNCDGKDFKLTVDKTTKKATLKLCKQVPIAGVMEGAVIKNSLTVALKQFSTVNKVVILDYSGNCFEDLSGLNLCLE